MLGGGADLAASSDTFSLVHDPFAVRDNLDLPPEYFEGHQDAEELGAVNGLDGPQEGPVR